MRVTQNMLYQNSLSAILRNQEKVLDYQNQVNTQKRVNQASDGPLDMSRVLALREELSATVQYERNISKATSWLTATETALQEVTDLVRGARTLALAQANGTQSDDSRETAIEEVLGIIDSLINLGNTQVGNSYIFGGTRTTVTPFNSDGTYNGNGSSILSEINKAIFEQINVAGSQFLVADLNPDISEPHSSSGKLAYEYSGSASGQRAQLSNWVVSSPEDNYTYDFTVTLDDGTERKISYTTDASATQDELGRGLVRAVEQDDVLGDEIQADYEDGVLTLTAVSRDSSAGSYRLRSVISPFSTTHSQFSASSQEMKSNFVFNSTNSTLKFTETGYGLENTIADPPSGTSFSLTFGMGDITETVEVSYAAAPSGDALGADLAQAVNENTTLSEWLHASYDEDTNQFVVVAKTGVSGADDFTVTQGSGAVFDAAATLETEFDLKTFELTTNIIEDSGAVSGVAYGGQDTAKFLNEALEATSAAYGFSLSYDVEFDFVDDQETKNRFTITNVSSNDSTVELLWSDPDSSIRETLGFAALDSSDLVPGDADTSEGQVEFNILENVNDRFRINVDGGGFVTIVLTPGAYTAKELADHIQSTVNSNPAAGDVWVTFSEADGGQFTFTSKSSGTSSTVRLMAGEGAERESDFLRTIGFASEAGLSVTPSVITGSGSVDGFDVLNLEPFENPEAHEIELIYSSDPAGSPLEWHVTTDGGYLNLSVVESDDESVELDFDGDGASDLRLNISGAWSSGDVVSVELSRSYRESVAVEDGTDSVFLKDLNGGQGIGMSPPVSFTVDAFNDTIQYVDDGASLSLQIPAGDYTGEELAEVLEGQFGSGYTVSYSDGRFSILKDGGTLTLDWNDPNSTAIGLLGFEAQAASGALAYTSDYPVETIHLSVMDRAGNEAQVDMAAFEVIGSGADQNNGIYFADAGVTIRIPPGYYTGDQLASVIESRLEYYAPGNDDYSVTFRDGTFSVTNNSGNPFEISMAFGTSAADLLGFDDTSLYSGEQSYTSETVIPELTINDLLERMNSDFADAGVKITASVNKNGNGIELVDTNAAKDRIVNMRVFESESASDLGIYKEDRLITIDDRTNTIYFTSPAGSGGITYKAEINPGTYNGNDMAAAIKTAMEQAVNIDDLTDLTTLDFEVEYLPERGVFSIVPSGEAEFHWVSGAPDGEGSKAASVLGITEDWVFSGAGPFIPQYSNETAGSEGIAGTIVGTDLNPVLTGYTGIGDLYEGKGLDLGTITIVNGEKETSVDLSGVNNIQELMERINSADVGVRAVFNSRQSALKIESLVDGTVPVVLSEGDDDTAQLLGLSAGYDLLETMNDFARALEENDANALQNVVASLDASLERLENYLGDTGSRLINVEETTSYLQEYTLNVETLLTDTEGVDATEAITRLLNQEYAYEAALQTTANLLSVSLLNYLS